MNSEEYIKTTDKAMESFVKGLEELSLKTGIVVDITGGVQYYTPESIECVKYTKDFSSSDIQSYVNFKEDF